MLRLADVTVEYDDVVAVDRIGFDVAASETLALIGRSGSGKSSLLHAIAGTVTPTQGRIELDGIDLTAMPTHRRRVGLVFQDFALFPHLSVADNVAYGLRATGTSDVAASVERALAMVSLTGLDRRRIDQLSGGQAQRVALARTLVTRPDILLLDEPLGSLDPALRADVARELDDLLSEIAIPTIIVTHDTSEALALGDRIAVLADGALIAIGPPDAVWQRPGTAEAARILGHQNVLTVSVSDGQWQFGDTTIPIPAPSGSHEVLILPGAVSPTPSGVPGTVLSSRFSGPAWVTLADIAGTTIATPTPTRHDPGRSIRLTIDPGGIVLLDGPSAA